MTIARSVDTANRVGQVITGVQYGLKALSYVPYAGKIGAVAKVIGEKPLSMIGQVAGLGDRIVTDITGDTPAKPQDTADKVLSTASKVAGYGASVLGVVGTGLELASPYLVGTALTAAELAVPGIGWVAAGASAVGTVAGIAQWLKG